jgi:hypothetical protein
MKAGGFVVKVLREAGNEGTLRAFRNADRFPTLKIFRRPGALRRRVAPGQSRGSGRIGWKMQELTLLASICSLLHAPESAM